MKLPVAEQHADDSIRTSPGDVSTPPQLLDFLEQLFTDHATPFEGMKKWDTRVRGAHQGTFFSHSLCSLYYEGVVS